MTVNGGPDIIEDGLVLYLDAANRRSYPGTGTTWYDIYQNNFTATLTNGPTFTNNRINFDGSNDYSVISSSPTFALPGDFTLEGWFLPTTVSATFPLMVCGTTGGMWFGFEGGLRIYAVANVVTGAPIVANAWNHLLVSRIGSTVSLYHNGVFITSAVSSHSFVAANLYTGVDNAGIGQDATYVNGSVSLLRMYKNKGFTSQEVLRNFRATPRRGNA